MRCGRAGRSDWASDRTAYRDRQRAGLADPEPAHHGQPLEGLPDVLLEGLVAGCGEHLLLEYGEVDGVGVLQQALVAVPGAHAGLLDAAGGRALRGVRRSQRVVDVDVAGVDPLRHRHGVVQVGAPDARVQPVGSVVGQPHGLVDRGVAVQCHHRAERLARADQHLRGDVLEDRRLVERRAEVGALAAAADDRRALLHRVGDVRGDPVLVVHGDQ